MRRAMPMRRMLRRGRLPHQRRSCGIGSHLRGDFSQMQNAAAIGSAGAARRLHGRKIRRRYRVRRRRGPRRTVTFDMTAGGGES